MRKIPYAVRAVAQRLRVVIKDFTAYPDIVMNCPPDECSLDDPNALLDAAVVIEVLSPATERYDSGVKFELYCGLPSLRHYVLIAQHRMEVEHRWFDAQSGAGPSEIFTAPGDIVRLSAIGCTLSVAGLYERVEF